MTDDKDALPRGWMDFLVGAIVLEFVLGGLALTIRGSLVDGAASLVFRVLLVSLVAMLPGEIARRRGLKRAIVVHALGLGGMFVGVTWPVALVWSLVGKRPV